MKLVGGSSRGLGVLVGGSCKIYILSNTGLRAPRPVPVGDRAEDRTRTGVGFGWHRHCLL